KFMAKFRALTLPKGWIEVICGPMFAGKSDELIRRLNKLIYADVEYVIFKPKTDTRTLSEIKSRNGLVDSAIVIEQPYDILHHLMETRKMYNVVAVDEAQFFDESLVEVADILADHGYVVIIAGLDRDFKGSPFGPIPELLTYADIVNKLTAICTECGAPATRTQRLIDGHPANYNDPLVLIGNTESYTARCRHCHKIPGKPMSEAEEKFKKFTGKLMH
ncbi:MAG: thymidine kinase, partial [Mycoplasma sp.]